MEMENKKVRINKYDNLKGLAMFLIVLGHMSYFDFFLVNGLDGFIYIIHLPIFFFVSGYFSKIDIDQGPKLFKRLIVPYLIFSLLFYIFFLQWGIATPALFIVPSYALWFLLALFFMRMLLPILDKLRYPILTALILALLFGFLKLNQDVLGIRRFFMFLPVFLVGYNYKRYSLKIRESYESLYSLLGNKITIIIVAILVVSAGLYIGFNFPFRLIIMKSPYEEPYWYYICLRFAIIMIGIVSTLLIHKLMTNRECFLTKWGRNSMAIFLLHIFIVNYIQEMNINIFTRGLTAFAFSFIVSVIIVFILSRDVISKYLTLFTDAVADFILDLNK